MNITKILLIIFVIATIGCSKNSNSSNIIELSSSEEYTYDLKVSGDEEGATIVTQAKHFEKSELVRNASTNYSIVYKYKAIDGYEGNDFVEIKTLTGGDVNGTNSTEDIIRIDFKISN